MGKKLIPRLPGESEYEFKRRRWNEWDTARRRALGAQPKRKNFGQGCSVEGCERLSEVKGMCGKHYRKQRLEERAAAGIQETDIRHHPLYITWRERRIRGSLCASWAQNFRQFAADVGERPSPTHLLRKLNRAAPYSPTNFEWLDALSRKDGESDADFHARKWKSRKERLPDFEIGRHLMRTFGINPARYAEIHEAQNGVCAICQKPETAMHAGRGKVRNLSVDHCHTSGAVRGLLCWRCNGVLGRMEDNPELIRSMAAYLERGIDYR